MFHNQVIWLTGASSGIGEALAKQLCQQGSKLILSARRESELERVKQACIKNGANEEDLLVLPLDLSLFFHLIIIVIYNKSTLSSKCR